MFYSKLFGFLSERSTFDGLAEITNQIRQGSTETFTCILLYIRKIFGSSSHEVFLVKLEKYGARRICLILFASNLKKRDRKILDFFYLPVGVPQGSILGLQLFVIYIIDLSSACEILNTILFADYTNLAYRRNQDKLSLLNKILENVPKLLSVDSLVLYIDKTQAITF